MQLVYFCKYRVYFLAMKLYASSFPIVKKLGALWPALNLAAIYVIVSCWATPLLYVHQGCSPECKFIYNIHVKEQQLKNSQVYSML